MKKEEELESLYSIEIKQLANIDNFSQKPTNPLLLSVPKDYDEKFKLMLFGQETNDWHGLYLKNMDIKNEMNKYKNFWITKESRFSNVGPLMQTFNNFQKGINNASCIWNNIIKIGKYNAVGTPNEELIEWQMNWFNVIKKEVELLEPNVMIFFTGPKYDEFIKKVFGGFAKEKVMDEKSNQLSKLVFHNNPNMIAYRTYHPSYLRRSGLGTKYLDFFNTEISKLMAKKEI